MCSSSKEICTQTIIFSLDCQNTKLIRFTRFMAKKLSLHTPIIYIQLPISLEWLLNWLAHSICNVNSRRHLFKSNNLCMNLSSSQSAPWLVLGEFVFVLAIFVDYLLTLIDELAQLIIGISHKKGWFYNAYEKPIKPKLYTSSSNP